jgi:hypothetical protein
MEVAGVKRQCSVAKAKSGGGSSKGTKIVFTKQAKGKTSIGSAGSSIKFGSMNKDKRRNFKAYRGQGRP